MPVSFARYLSLVFLILAWTLPYAIVGHTYPLPTFYAEFVTLVLYLGLAAAVGWLTFAQRRRFALTSPRVAIVPLLFAFLLLLQTVLLPTSQPSMNVLGAGCLLVAYLSTHAGYWLGRLESFERVLSWGAVALVLGGLFAVFCQLVQLFHAEARFTPFVVAYNIVTDRRPFGNMAQANHLATYISFAMAAALFLVQTRRLPFAAWLVLSAVFATGEALTVSRGPWLQTCVVIVGALAVAWMQGRQNRAARGWAKQRLWLMPLLLLAIFLAVNAAVRWANLAYHWQLAESAAERFQDAGQISPRLALWKYGWTMFKGHPWLGVGWGEFPRFQYALVETLGKVELANNSHNIVIDLLAKTGIVGLGVVVLGLGAWLRRVFAEASSPARIFCLVMLGALGTHALVEYPQQYLFFLLPAAFVIGLLETRPMRSVAPRLAHVTYGLLVVVGLATLYPVYRDYKRAEVLYYGTDPEQQYRAAPAHVFGAWGEYGLSTLLSINANDLATKLAMHRQAMTLLPGETVVRRYAVLLALAGREDEALDAVRRLKIFAEMLHDWPTQRADVFKLCDQQGAKLAAFRSKLVALYGEPPKSTSDENDDDSDD